MEVSVGQVWKWRERQLGVWFSWMHRRRRKGHLMSSWQLLPHLALEVINKMVLVNYYRRTLFKLNIMITFLFYKGVPSLKIQLID